MKKILLVVLFLLFVNVVYAGPWGSGGAVKKISDVANCPDGKVCADNDGDMAVSGVLSIGDPADTTDTDYPLVEKTDDNGDIIGSITVGADTLTDGDQRTYLTMYSMNDGVLGKLQVLGTTSLADGSTFEVADGSVMGFFKVASSDGAGAIWGAYGPDGTITLDSDSLNGSTTENNDTTLNFFKSGDYYYFENELGITLDFVYEVLVMP